MASSHASTKLAPGVVSKPPLQGAAIVVSLFGHEVPMAWQAAALCFGRKHFMHVWYPNLHLPFLWVVATLAQIVKLAHRFSFRRSEFQALEFFRNFGWFLSPVRGLFNGCGLFPPPWSVSLLFFNLSERIQNMTSNHTRVFHEGPTNRAVEPHCTWLQLTGVHMCPSHVHQND